MKNKQLINNGIAVKGMQRTFAVTRNPLSDTLSHLVNINLPAALSPTGSLAAFVLGKILEISRIFLRFFLRARSQSNSVGESGLGKFICARCLKAVLKVVRMGNIMRSKLHKLLELEYQPIAIIRTNKKPEKALQFKNRKFGCIMHLAAQAAKGKTAVFDTHSYGCITAAHALGFGKQYHNLPFDIDYYYSYLSNAYGYLRTEKHC